MAASPTDSFCGARSFGSSGLPEVCEPRGTGAFLQTSAGCETFWQSTRRSAISNLFQIYLSTERDRNGTSFSALILKKGRFGNGWEGPGNEPISSTRWGSQVQLLCRPSKELQSKELRRDRKRTFQKASTVTVSVAFTHGWSGGV
jgi:hypothetical protein